MTTEQRAEMIVVRSIQIYPNGPMLRNAYCKGAKWADETNPLLEENEKMNHAIAGMGIDFGADKEKSEKNYLAAVNGRREFRNSYRSALNRISELEAALTLIEGSPADRLKYLEDTGAKIGKQYGLVTCEDTYWIKMIARQALGRGK